MDSTFLHCLILKEGFFSDVSMGRASAYDSFIQSCQISECISLASLRLAPDVSVSLPNFPNLDVLTLLPALIPFVRLRTMNFHTFHGSGL